MESYPFKQHLFFATGIGISMSVLYMVGFWGSFGFNAFEFMSFSDLAGHTVLPLLISSMAPLIGMGLSQLFFGDALPLGGGANTPIGQFGRRNWRWMILGLVILIFLVFLLGTYEMKLTFIPLFLSFFSTPLTHLDVAITVFPEPRFRAAALYLAILLPALSFSLGNF